MDPFVADNQPLQAGAEAEVSALGVRHPGSQAGAEYATEGVVFGDQLAGRPTGPEGVGGSVFRLRPPGSGQIPGRIVGGRPPVRASTPSSRLVAAVAVDSRSAIAKKKKSSVSVNLPNGSASKSQEDQDLSAASSSPPQVVQHVHEPAAAEVEGANGPVEISDDDDGEEEEAEIVVTSPKRRKFISPVWMQFDRLKIGGRWMARCIHCSKKLSGETKNGTTHLYNHPRGNKKWDYSSLQPSETKDVKIRGRQAG